MRVKRKSLECEIVYLDSGAIDHVRFLDRDGYPAAHLKQLSKDEAIFYVPPAVTSDSETSILIKLNAEKDGIELIEEPERSTHEADRV